ncbi:MAG: hypothetical protein M3Q10_02620 [Chloroflexota bacterium]|nr:hypothetical protein [Chloroflexota bacterium]
MAWVDVRCPSHLWFRLDPDRGLIEVKCGEPRCGCRGFHYFDARTGGRLREPEQGEAGSGAVEAPTDPSDGTFVPLGRTGASGPGRPA